MMRGGSCRSQKSAADEMESIFRAFVGLSRLTFCGRGIRRQFGFGGVSGHQRRIMRTRVALEGAAGGKTGWWSAGGSRGCAAGLRHKADTGAVKSGQCYREWRLAGDLGVRELNGSGEEFWGGAKLWVGSCESFGYRRGGVFVHHHQKAEHSQSLSRLQCAKSGNKGVFVIEHSQSLSRLQCAKSGNKGVETKGYSTQHTLEKDTQLPTETGFLSTTVKGLYIAGLFLRYQSLKCVIAFGLRNVKLSLVECCVSFLFKAEPDLFLKVGNPIQKILSFIKHCIIQVPQDTKYPIHKIQSKIWTKNGVKCTFLSLKNEFWAKQASLGGDGLEGETEFICMLQVQVHLNDFAADTPNFFRNLLSFTRKRRCENFITCGIAVIITNVNHADWLVVTYDPCARSELSCHTIYRSFMHDELISFGCNWLPFDACWPINVFPSARIRGPFRALVILIKKNENSQTTRSQTRRIVIYKNKTGRSVWKYTMMVGFYQGMERLITLYFLRETGIRFEDEGSKKGGM
ncbi:hypothetical protein VP01_1709g3 [Puccinia sorghi]|uniref:Uncharacterized protein n=1 Tax=Puccinia sorghi TaxID=27349 RepID=A0A0L6VFH0_9BASI|nr:hypothetical protein VP01_1709g3 [Puccinia sorghi]